MRWFWMLGLTLAALEDWEKRELPYWLLWLWLVPGICNVAAGDVWQHLGAASVGAGMLLVSFATRGALGAGDGLFFLMSACYLDLRETVFLFLIGLGISAFWSMALFMRGCLTASGRERGTIPFLTCAWLPGLWLVCSRG